MYRKQKEPMQSCITTQLDRPTSLGVFSYDNLLQRARS